MVDRNSSSVAKASMWSFFGQLIVKVLPPLTNMILARIFVPEVFGIVTTVTMITSFADILTEGGFTRFLVRQQYSDENELKKDANVAFWTNLFISLSLWGLIIVFRNDLSDSLSSENISNVIVIACIQLPITSFSGIQNAIAQRKYDFRKIFFSQMISSIFNLIITLFLALTGMSFWAIIVGNICSYIIRAIVLSIRSTWQPRLYFSITRLKKMFAFSMWIYLEAIAVWFTSWADSFFVGSRLNSHDLGIYKNSQSMVNGVLSIPQYSITNVLLVTLSNDIGNHEKYQRDFFFAQRLMAYILFPIGFGILLYRDFAVRIVFGSGWEDATLIVGLWAFVSVFRIVYMSVTSAAYISSGKPRASFYLQIVDMVILIPTCIYGIKLGFVWFVIIRCIVRLAIIPINLLVLDKSCAIPVIDVIKNTTRPLMISLVMFVTGFLVKWILPNTVLLWIIGVIICMVIYFIAFYLVSRKDFQMMFLYVKKVI